MKNPQADRYIYIALFRTPFRMGKFIRMMTHYPYNHVAISFYSDLRRFFSFARRHKYAPFYGGFIYESLLRYPRDEKTTLKVFRLRLTAPQYQALCDFIRPFTEDPGKFRYNFLSAVSSMFSRRVKLENAYTCVEFVADALRASGFETAIPDYCDIPQLDRLLTPYLYYEGTVLGYPAPKMWYGDDYAERLPLSAAIHETVNGVKENFSDYRRVKKNRTK